MTPSRQIICSSSWYQLLLLVNGSKVQQLRGPPTHFTTACHSPIHSHTPTPTGCRCHPRRECWLSCPRTLQTCRQLEAGLEPPANAQPTLPAQTHLPQLDGDPIAHTGPANFRNKLREPFIHSSLGKTKPNRWLRIFTVMDGREQVHVF